MNHTDPHTDTTILRLKNEELALLDRRRQLNGYVEFSSDAKTAHQTGIKPRKLLEAEADLEELDAKVLAVREQLGSMGVTGYGQWAIWR